MKLSSAAFCVYLSFTKNGVNGFGPSPFISLAHKLSTQLSVHQEENNVASYNNPLSKAHPRDKPRKKTGNLSPSKRRRLEKRPMKNDRSNAIAKGNDPLLSLNINLDYLAKSGRAIHAEELLVKIEKMFESGYYAIRPDNVSYNSVLNAYAMNESEEYDSVKEVQRLLKKMEALSEQGLSAVQPNIVTLNTVCLAFAKNNQPEKAHQLLNDMEELYQSGKKDLGPNTITFNSVICAYAKAKKPQEAEELLKRMMTISRENDGEREDEIKADTIAFNTILHAWAVSNIRGAPLRAQQLLDHMTTLYNAGNEDVKPDVFSYTATLSAWAGATYDPQASDRALEILHLMENQCALGNKDACPNAVTYTAVINCVGKSGKPNAALEAYEILLSMEKRWREGEEDLRPDLITYSSVIDAFARSGEDYAGEKAVELLDYMITLAESGYPQYGPNTQTYCSVISALGKSKMRGNADAANQLLNDMEKMYELGNTDVAPNTIIFNAVIDAWAKSSFRFKALRARDLVDKMETEYQAGNIHYKPDIITYNSVINAGASSFGDQAIKSNAFRIAMDAFKRIQLTDDLKANSVTYSLLLKAIRKLISKEEQRQKMSGKIMEYCIKEGLFNKHIATQLELTCGSKINCLQILKGLGYMGTNPKDLRSFPESWKCNAGR